jgi:hypothetical protein
LPNRLQRCRCEGTSQAGEGTGSDGAHGPARSGRQYAGVAAALTAALLPKCPFCVAGYAALLGLVGVRPPAFQVWTAGLTVVMAGIALAALAYRCRGSRMRGPLLAGSLGVAALVSGKLYAEQPLLVWAGLLFIVAAYAGSGRGVPAVIDSNLAAGSRRAEERGQQ